MSTQEQRSRATQPADEGVDESQVAAAVNTDQLDDLLDEIDEVLEENAEEFVRGFVQKGGQ